MDSQRIYKTPVSEITSMMSMVEKTQIVDDIITIFRENTNHQELGKKMEVYVKDILSKEQEGTVSILDNWDERE